MLHIAFILHATPNLHARSHSTIPHPQSKYLCIPYRRLSSCPSTSTFTHRIRHRHRHHHHHHPSSFRRSGPPRRHRPLLPPISLLSEPDGDDDTSHSADSSSSDDDVTSSNSTSSSGGSAPAYASSSAPDDPTPAGGDDDYDEHPDITSSIPAATSSAATSTASSDDPSSATNLNSSDPHSTDNSDKSTSTTGAVTPVATDASTPAKSSKPNRLSALAASIATTLKRCFAPPAFFVGTLVGISLSALLFFLPALVGPRDALLREKVTLFDVILHDINDSYVDQVDINRLFETGVNSMLGTLDPYTQFENNAQAMEMSVKTNGRYAGVGLGLALGDPTIGADVSDTAAMDENDEGMSFNEEKVGNGGGSLDSETTVSPSRPIVVVSAFEGYAFDAGVRPGDIIHSVAGRSVIGSSLEEVTDMLRGDPGTFVDIAVMREGFSDPLLFTLSRKSVHIKDVPAATFLNSSVPISAEPTSQSSPSTSTPSSSAESTNDSRTSTATAVNRRDAGDAGNVSESGGIAYIRLQSFAKDAASEVSDALTGLISSGRRVDGVVLDLRGNPGGLLNAAIEVAELLVPKGSTIVSTKGRGLGPGPVYMSARDPVVKANTPLAVLVNGQTASASEIVAGAVQDLDLGVVVGSRTFGKGLVQNVQELPFNTALKYTVGKYYTPSGRCIQSLNYTQGHDGDRAFESRAVEESQRKEFRTAGGRLVRDGGGIEPDVEVEKRPSFLEVALQRQNMYFRFATRFGATSKLEKLPADFTVTDGIYKEFVKFVSESGFKYESRFDKALDQLDGMFKEVGYETARGKVNDLKKVTNAEMHADFDRHEGDIRIQVESAIRYRFQPDSERIIAELKSDEQLEKAIEVLLSRQQYQHLLISNGGEGDGDGAATVEPGNGMKVPPR